MSTLNVANLTVTGNNSYVSQIAFGDTSNTISVSTSGVISYQSVAADLINGFTLGNTVVLPAAVTPGVAINAGINFTGINGGIVNTQIFTANGSWIKPPGLTGNEQFFIMMWGAGGSATGFTDSYRGGGGGACFLGTFPLSSIDNNCIVVVGGLGDLGDGRSSTFVANSSTTFFAGGGGSAGADGPGSGSTLPSGGGGWVTAGGPGSVANGNFSWRYFGGHPIGGYWRSVTTESDICSIYGGGGARAGTINSVNFYKGGDSIFGGGGAISDSITIGDRRGNSIFGGGGGGGISMGGGYSVIGGGGSGGIPGGGGSDSSIPNHVTTVGQGARGEVRVWILGSRI